jgi:dUTP pyrophosphatase
MNVNIKRLHVNAVIPQYATTGAAAFDLVAVSDVVISPGETKLVPLGLAFEIPVGYVLLIAMRSGIALKTELRQPNGIGVIDSDYRGEVSMMFDNTYPKPNEAMQKMFPTIPLGFTDCILTLDGGQYEIYGGRFTLGTYKIYAGERVAQGFIQPVPTVVFTIVDELGVTARGTGGFGHTGTTTAPAVSP